MTNRELRKRALLLRDVSIRSNLGHSYEGAILRLLDEHQQMKEVLWYYAANYTGSDLAAEVLASLKDDES